MATPIGVLGIIYESRPNVTADAGALCIKSGNAAILRGGSESFHSSRALHAALVEGLEAAGLPAAAIQLVPTTDRAAVGHMLAGLGGAIELIVPRGGKSLVARVQAEARVPVLAHLEGVCHTYVHEKADLAKARALVLNGKMRRTGVCGATETLLIDAQHHRHASDADPGRSRERGLRDQGRREGARALSAREAGDRRGLAHRVSRRHHRRARGRRRRGGDPPHRDLRLAAHRVDRHRGQGRRGAFLNALDSAIVMHNASTQFADGGEFGMGAEIGIGTGKLHARGPVGVEQLTIFKYVVRGNGQTRP